MTAASLTPTPLEFKPFVCLFAAASGAHPLEVGWRSADLGLFFVEGGGIFFLMGLDSYWETLLLPVQPGQADGKSWVKQPSPILGQRRWSETQVFPLGVKNNAQIPGATLQALPPIWTLSPQPCVFHIQLVFQPRGT